MKCLITVNSLKSSISGGENVVCIDKEAIITPAAMDLIKEKKIRIETSGCTEKNQENTDYELIYRIVKKILSENNHIKKEDNSGVIYINNPGDLEPVYRNKNVYIKDILNSRETSSMCAGFMLIESTKYDMKVKNDEIQYVIEGQGVIVTKEGELSRVKKGDTVYIPQGSEISWDVKGKIQLFYVSS